MNRLPGNGTAVVVAIENVTVLDDRTIMCDIITTQGERVPMVPVSINLADVIIAIDEFCTDEPNAMFHSSKPCPACAKAGAKGGPCEHTAEMKMTEDEEEQS